MNIAGLVSGAGEIAQAAGESITDAATDAATGAIVNNLPGAGLLFRHDPEDGFSVTAVGALLLGSAAAYGVIRFLGR